LKTVSTELRSPELEAAIEAAPEDANRYAVYGDWLQQHGVVRGELIALHLAHRSSREWREREQRLILHPSIRVLPLNQMQWRWGFVHTLRFETNRHDAWEAHGADWPTALLRPKLEHPSCRFVRELIVEGDPGDLLLRFLKTSAPRLLNALYLVCNEVDLASMPALPRLERLSIACQLMTPAALELTGLRELKLPLDAGSIDGAARVLRSVAMSLRSLTLTSLEPLRHASLAPVLVPHQLETLVLRANDMHADAVRALAESPLRRTLKTLDVSRTGLSEEGAARLLEVTATWPQLETLRMNQSGART